MSLTLVSRSPRSRVTVGGEFDRGGRRGFVLLAVSPSPALLTRGVARQVARSLVMFAERVRPAKANRARSEAADKRRGSGGKLTSAASRDAGQAKKGGPHHAASALAEATHTSRATARTVGRRKRVSPVT